MKILYIDYSLLLRFDNLITATQMHEGEETQQSVVIAIEEAFFIWFMFGIPEMTDEFPALHMIADQ